MRHSIAALAASVLIATLPLDLRGAEAPIPVEAFSIFDKEFLKKQGIQPELDHRDTKQAAHLVAAYFRKRKEPRYFSWADQRPDKPNKTFNASEAEAVLQGKFVVRYGQPPVLLSPPINWTEPSAEGRKLDDQETAVLHRGLWEDSLSEAYWQTRDKKYVEGLIRILHDWRKGSPPPPLDQGSGIPGRADYAPAGYPGYPGINVGSRMACWMNAFYRMRDCEAFSDQEMLFFLSLVSENGQRLAAITRATADDASRRISNHLTVSYRGLFYAGLLFPELQGASEWKDLAVQSLETQAKEAVGDDGFQWEHSPGYHTNCIKDYIVVQRLASLNHTKLSDTFTAKIESMYECIEKLMYPNKHLPLINDSGADLYGPSEMALGACLFKRPDFKFAATADLGFPALTVGGVTTEEAKAYAALKPKPPAFLSVAMEASGHYIMRTGWDPLDKYLLLTQGKYAGWHSHADQLAIDLYAFGRPILVDSGSCHYADPAHHFLQSAEAHNVVLVDGEGCEVQSPSSISLWMATPGADAVSGETKFPSGHVWRRTVAFVKPDFWIVHDEVQPSGDGPHKVTQLWHYVPGEAKASKDSVLFVRPPAPQAEGNLLMKWPADETRAPGKAKGFLSTPIAGSGKPDNSGKAETEYLTLGQEGKETLSFATLLYPYRGDKPPEAEIVSEHVPGGTAVRVRQKDREDVLLVAGGKEPLKVWGYELDAGVAVLRLAGKKLERAVLKGGSRFQAPDNLTATSEKPFEGATFANKGGKLEAEKP